MYNVKNRESTINRNKYARENSVAKSLTVSVKKIWKELDVFRLDYRCEETGNGVVAKARERDFQACTIFKSHYAIFVAPRWIKSTSRKYPLFFFFYYFLSTLRKYYGLDFKKKIDFLFISFPWSVPVSAKRVASIHENTDDIKVWIHIPATCEIYKRNFKCVLLKTLFFKLASISQDLVDQLTSHFERIFSRYTFIAETEDSSK